jgi:hypothetical protein
MSAGRGYARFRVLLGLGAANLCDEIRGRRIDVGLNLDDANERKQAAQTGISRFCGS